MKRSDDEEVSEGSPGDQAYGLGRILALSDGVFAFALTLLVIQLIVPTASSHSSLSSQLLDQTPSFFSYVISFTAVASTWYGHTRTSNTFTGTTGASLPSISDPFS